MRPISAAVSLVLATMLIAWGASVAQAGTLNGTLSGSAAVDFSLTTAGDIDWAIWGFAENGTSTSLTPDDHKAGGAGISALTDISNGTPLRGLGQFGDFAHTFSWTNGTPVASASFAEGGLQHNSTMGQPNIIGEGFSFTVPADTARRRVRVFVTAHEGVGTFTAALSDGSAPAYVQDLGDNVSGNLPGVYQIDYAADSAGQTLNVSFILTQKGTTQFANVAVFAVSLGTPRPATAVPSASGAGLVFLSVLLFAAGALLLRRHEHLTARTQ